MRRDCAEAPSPGRCGPVVTLLFENRVTIRLQVQEMARAERMLSDEAIQGESFSGGPVTLAIAHADYAEQIVLGEDTRQELLRDLRGIDA